MIGLCVAFGESIISLSSEALSNVLYQDTRHLVEAIFYSCEGERGQGWYLYLDLSLKLVWTVFISERWSWLFHITISSHIFPIAISIPARSRRKTKQCLKIWLLIHSSKRRSEFSFIWGSLCMLSTA